jgi:hypothetical protein
LILAAEVRDALAANRQLVFANARLGAKLAAQLSRQPSGGQRRSR